MSRIAHLAIFGLLASIELLPVLFKTFKQWSRRPTAYECRWRDLDNDQVLRTRIASRYALHRTAQEAYGPIRAARQIQANQAELARYTSTHTVEIQAAHTQKQLQEWARTLGLNDYRVPELGPLTDVPLDEVAYSTGIVDVDSSAWPASDPRSVAQRIFYSKWLFAVIGGVVSVTALVCWLLF